MRIRTLTLMFYLVLTNVMHAQFLTEAEEAELRLMAANVDVDSNYANGNWKSLLAPLDGKNMILLGEFDHESKEVFKARNDLIKFLHKRYGFDVILFEAGLGEMGAVDLYQKELSGRQMTLGFFGNWRTKSFSELMNYTKRHKISIGGFDVQRTNSSLVSKFLYQSLQKIDVDSLHIHDLENRFSTEDKKLRDRNAEYDSVSLTTQILIDDFANLDRLLSDIPNADIELSLLRRTIFNRQEYLKYRLTFLKDQNWRRRWDARDRAMADNVQWLKSHFFPERKIILVAHNYHIAKHNRQAKVMGEFLKRKYGSESYVLGVFSGAGSKTNGDGKIISHTAPDSTHLDIKNIVRTLNGRVHFLHIPTVERDEVSWWNTNITTNDTFIDVSGSNQLILDEHFDGLLLLDSVSTSIKLW